MLSLLFLIAGIVGLTSNTWLRARGLPIFASEAREASRHTNGYCLSMILTPVFGGLAGYFGFHVWWGALIGGAISFAAAWILEAAVEKSRKKNQEQLLTIEEVERCIPKKNGVRLVWIAGHANPEVGAGAARALDEIGLTAEYVEANRSNPYFLKWALRNKNAGVRRAAIKGLRAKQWKPENDTERAWYCVAGDDFEAAAGLGGAALEPLRLRLASDDDPRIREKIQRLLDDQGFLANQVIQDRLGPADPAFKKLRDQEQIDRVIHSFGDDEERLKPFIEQADNQVFLVRLVQSKLPRPELFKMIIERITDQPNLATIARTHSSHDVRRWAAASLTDEAELTSIACAKDCGDRWDVARAAADRLEDPNLLRRVAREAHYEQARLCAAKKAADAEVLIEIAAKSPDDIHRLHALEALDTMKSQAAWETLARSGSLWAIARLTSPEVLVAILRSDDKSGRVAAYERLGTVAPELVLGDEFAHVRAQVTDARIDSIKQSLDQLIFAEGYPFNAAAFAQDSEYRSAIQQLIALARAGNARARDLAKAARIHALECFQGIHVMRVTTLYRGELRIAYARHLANQLEEFADTGKSVEENVVAAATHEIQEAPATIRTESGTTFERFDTKSQTEAVDALFQQAVPSLPVVTTEDVNRICSQTLKYEVRHGKRHVSGTVETVRPILVHNLKNVGGQLYPGQQVIGFQVMVQPVLQFAALSIVVGDRQGSPGYMFGARTWRVADQVFVLGWEGFQTSS
jgi:hypothetical protein